MKSIRLLVVMIVTALPLAAQEWVAGIEGTNSATYTYLTHYSQNPVGAKTQVVWWQTASYLSYRVREGGESRRVNSPGLDAGAMLRWNSARTTAGVGAGYEIRWTERERAAGGTLRETEQGPLVVGDVATRFGPRTTGRVAGRYSAANQWRSASADLRQQITRSLAVGPQVIWQGNDDVEVLAVGGFIEIPLGSNAFQVRAGQARVENRDGTEETEPYLSAGIVIPF